jgi:hypothetical protein
MTHQPLMRLNICYRWDKRSRAFVVDNLFSIECAELDDLVAVLEVRLRQRDKDRKDRKIEEGR